MPTQIFHKKSDALRQVEYSESGILKIASMRFKTIITEIGSEQEITLELPIEADLHGFVILLQPALPSII